MATDAAAVDANTIEDWLEEEASCAREEETAEKTLGVLDAALLTACEVEDEGALEVETRWAWLLLLRVDALLLEGDEAEARNRALVFVLVVVVVVVASAFFEVEAALEAELVSSFETEAEADAVLATSDAVSCTRTLLAES